MDQLGILGILDKPNPWFGPSQAELDLPSPTISHTWKHQFLPKSDGFPNVFLDFPFQTGRIEPNYPKVCGHQGNVLDIKWNPFIENIIASCSEDTSVSRNFGIQLPDPSILPTPLIPCFDISMGFLSGMLRDRRSKPIPHCAQPGSWARIPSCSFCSGHKILGKSLVVFRATHLENLGVFIPNDPKMWSL